MSLSIKKIFGKNSERQKLKDLQRAVRELEKQNEISQMLAAQALVRLNRAISEPVPLEQTEFKVFSQFGDDGIIQYIVHRLQLPASERRFVEFGVESYREANTRFLLQNDNWSGLIMDGSDDYMSGVQREEIYWKHDLTARGAFITRENINDLLRDAGFTGRIGLLSIDIDGNDYWVWQAITAVDPALVIVEYNSLFGAHAPVTVPYQPDFTRTAAHFSNLYWGTSLAALCHLAAEKNYVWIGCNSAGNNAYFVRKADSARFLCPQLPEGFVAAKFREARNPDGTLSYLGQSKGFPLVADLPVWNVVENRSYPLSQIVR